MPRITEVPKLNNPQLILLTGNAGSGKTHACLNELIDCFKNPQNRLSNHFLYILPNAEHRERMTDLLLRQTGRTGTAPASRGFHVSSELHQAIPGFFGNIIVTFDEILDSLIRFSEIEFASNITRQLILKDIIQSSDLIYFKEAAQTRGFVELISGIISELKEALVSETDFKEIASRLKTPFPHFGQKYDELLLIYSQYEKRLAGLQLRDRHDALFLFEEQLKSGRLNLNRFQFKHIWLDGFLDFSNLQLSFIRLLAAYCDRMVVTLTYNSNPKRAHLFQICSVTRSSLLQIGFKERALPKKYYRSKSEALRIVEEALFSENPEQVQLTDSAVSILDATGIAGELEMIAREIKRISSDHKIHFSDFALLFRNVNPYMGVLQSVFTKYGIPIEMHEREELRLNSFAKAFASLIKIFVHHWTRDDIFNFFKSGYIKIDREFVWECEKISLKEGVVNGKTIWLSRFQAASFDFLNHTEENLQNAQGASQIAFVLRALIDQLSAGNLGTELTEQNQKDHAAVKRLQGLLDEICRKYQNEALTFNSFSEILLRLIDVDLFAFHSRDKNKVQIYNVSLARQKEYRVVFVPGLLEKKFPVQIKEDPIFSDSERREANKQNVILKERLPRQSLEKFFFYLAVTRASEKLYLTYPRFDLEGKEALPSFYVDEVKALFSSPISCVQQSVGDILPPPEWIMTEKEATSQAVRYFWQRGGRRNHRQKEASLVYYNRFRNSEGLQSVIHSLLFPAEGILRDERILQILKSENKIMTASRLETYAECAYRFFADYALGLQETEGQIDSKVVGTILHDVLQYFHEWRRDAGSISFEAAKAKCLEFLQKAFEAHPLTGDYRYQIELQKGRIEDMLLRAIDLELTKNKLPMEKLMPEYFEYSFGTGGDYLVIANDKQSVQVRGKIDRIDTDETKTYGLVIDYKTGKKFSAKSLKRGTQLQLPIYILAAEQKLGLKPLGGHLYSLAKTVSSGFHHDENLNVLKIKSKLRSKLNAEDWDELFREITNRILDHTEEIQNGKIAVKPRHCADFCPYSSVCRIEKWKLESIYRNLEVEDNMRYKTEKVK